MLWLLFSLGVLAAVYLLLCLMAWLLQERFIFVRFPIATNHRFRFAAPHEELWLQRDGARLHALRFTVADPKGALIYFHGNTGGLKRWGRLAHRFTQFGYEVLMPDPRGYGKSRGRLSEAALHADALAWHDLVRTRWPDERIVIYGRSLGAALAIPVAVSRPPRWLLLEAPFAELADVARNNFPFLPYRWLLRYPFRNEAAARGLRSPVRIFHGRRDQVVPVASALRLYAALPDDIPRAFHEFPRGHHNDLYKFAGFREVLHELLGA